MGGQSSKSIKVLLVGQADAGKTTLLYRMKLKLPQAEFSTTTGFNFEQVQVPGQKTQLAIWDLAGSAERQRFWKFFYEAVRVDVLLYVVSIDHKKSLGDAAKSYRYLRNEERLRSALKIIILNSDDEIRTSRQSVRSRKWSMHLALHEKIHTKESCQSMLSLVLV